MATPRVEAFSGDISPSKSPVSEIAQNALKGQIEGKETILQHYSDAEIDQLLVGTQNPGFLKKIIKCESQNTNIARMDSNGLISFGLLQFNGTATWRQFSALANVTGSPMEPKKAIKVADFMITHGKIARWTCARLTGLID